MGGRYAIRRLVVGSVMTLGLKLLSGCAAGRPTSLIRPPEGYEMLGSVAGITRYIGWITIA